jgi:protein-tyrosine phosphatase
MQDRVFSFEGVRNFRDFGAYRTRDGAWVNSGRLFRSAHFGEATETDIEGLDGTGVAFVIDLRRPEERAFQPNRWPGAGRAEQVTSDVGAVKEAPHIAFLRHGDLTEAGVDGFMGDTYEHLAYEQRHIDLFRGYFDRLDATDAAPSVVHCAAGKDRTGLLCALTLTALDVDRDTVFEDYLLTNTAAQVEKKLPMWQAWLEAQIGRKVPVEALKPFMGVKASYLETAITAIERQNGSLEGYLNDVLGVDAVRRDRLKAALLVEDAPAPSPLSALG